jgi:glycosyltransferase involved in cell wall biosynthesis
MTAENVLIIASRADIAGGENYLLSCFHYLDHTRYHPIVWLPGDGTFRVALEAAGVEYVIEPVNYGWLKPPKPWFEFLSGLPGRVRGIADLIRERDIKIVHTNSNMILEGALAAKLVGVRHLFLAHIDFQSNLPVYQRLPLDAASFARLMDDLSAGILAVSGHVRDTLCPPLPRERVVVVNNGLEMARYDAALAAGDGSLRQSLGLADDIVIVVAAGRVTEDKGFDLLIEAAGQLCPAYPRAVFLLCGPVDSAVYQSALLERIGQLGLEDHVRLLGRRDDLPDVMTQCDVFVLSSRREGHPYVLLEAMACNLPAVATRCGGVEETVVEGETGFVVPVGSAQALAEGLSPLLADAGLRTRMGQAAGRRVREHFTAAQTAQGLFDTYERLLAQPAPVAGSYSVDLLLLAAGEYGYLGERLTALEERVKKTERAAALLLDSPLMRLLRRLLKR